MKSYTRKILVNFDDCEVKSVSSTKEPDFPGLGLHAFFDPEFWDQDPYKDSSVQTYIIYKDKDGKKYVGGPFGKEQKAIELLLMEEKFTYIYVNEWVGQYEFDLKFIK